MTKEVRRYTITLEKSITINLLVDKEKPEREIENELTSYFEAYGDEWHMDEDCHAYCGKTQSLKQHMSENSGKKLEIYQFGELDDSDELSNVYEHELDILLREEEVNEREERDKAAQISLEV